MPRLLIVHHTPSPALQELFEAVVAGATDPDIEGVEVVRRPALSATASDVLDADGFVLGTPANIGYISGALKHFFDTVYYPCLDATRGRPFGAYVHGNLGVEGAVKALRDITTGLGWRPVAEPVTSTGAPDAAARERCRELGAAVAATLTL
ncbi:flavodoxin family protein [Actinosynnema sp. NPDC053489]|uniref:flavodoxin family protein n=1 Tax=Actinosynnema sp. NPDC053489 TaxID=3363916 RepID=UPI0037CB8918